MINRQQKSGKFVTSILAESPMPRNQISALSGLSNPYIKDLEEGAFKNVDREKLIALGLSLNLSLDIIDKLLNIFDRTNLTAEDFPTFIDLTKKRVLSSAMVPIFDGFPLWHAALSIERIPGDYFMVGRHLPIILEDSIEEKYTMNLPGKDHALYDELTKTYQMSRNKAFLKNLQTHSVHQFTCIDCVRDFFIKCESKKELKMRKDHMKRFIQIIETYPNFIVHLIPPCLKTYFALKIGNPKYKITDKISIGFEPSHMWDHSRRYQTGRLFGFQTSNPSVINSYKKEIENMIANELERYQDRSELLGFFNGLIQ